MDDGLYNSVINFFIDGQNLKEVKESSQDSICWNTTQWDLTPANSSRALSISCDPLELLIRTGHLVAQEFGIRQTRKTSKSGWAELWKEKYI